MRALESLTKLTYLDMSLGAIDDRMLNSITKLTNLRQLLVSTAHLSEKGEGMAACLLDSCLSSDAL